MNRLRNVAAAAALVLVLGSSLFAQCRVNADGTSSCGVPQANVNANAAIGQQLNQASATTQANAAVTTGALPPVNFGLGMTYAAAPAFNVAYMQPQAQVYGYSYGYQAMPQLTATTIGPVAPVAPVATVPIAAVNTGLTANASASVGGGVGVGNLAGGCGAGGCGRSRAVSRSGGFFRGRSVAVSKTVVRG